METAEIIYIKWFNTDLRYKHSAIGAIEEYAALRVAEKEAEILRLREAVCEWVNRPWAFAQEVQGAQFDDPGELIDDLSNLIGMQYNDFDEKWQLKQAE